MATSREYKIKAVVSAIDRVTKVLRHIESNADKSFKRIRRAAKAVSVGFGAVTKAAKWAGTAFVGAIGGTLFTIARVTAAVDDLAKTTRAIDFPIEDFQRWRFVAEQSGMSTEGFNKAAQVLAKQVGQLKSGTGELLTIFRRTDPAFVKQLKSVNNTSEAFGLVIEKLRNTTDATERAAIAQMAFGRSGLRMVNVAQLTQDEIAELMRQMDENGVVTAEAAAEAEKWRDMWNRLQLTLGGVLRDAIVQLLPALTDLADRFRKWVVANRDLIKQRLEKWLRRVVRWIEKFGEYLEKHGPDVDEWLRRIERFSKELYKFAQTAWENRYKILVALGAITAMRTAVGLLQFSSLINDMKGVGGAAETMATGLGGAASKAGLLALKLGAVALAAYGAYKGGEFLGEQIAKLITGDTKARLKVSQLGLANVKEFVAQVNTADMSQLAQLEASAQRMSSVKGFEVQAKKMQEMVANRRAQLAAGIVNGEAETFDAAVSVEQQRLMTETTEVVIRDETGRAEVTKPSKRGRMKLVRSAAI